MIVSQLLNVALTPFLIKFITERIVLLECQILKCVNHLLNIDCTLAVMSAMKDTANFVKLQVSIVLFKKQFSHCVMD